jgi:hypothetical protein
MRLTSTGLGIGTSSPGQKLEVNGVIKTSLGSGGLSLSGDTAPDFGYFGYNYFNNNGTETVGQSARSSHRITMGNGTTNAITFDYRAPGAAAGTWSERMRLDSTGLGIGTSSPANKLHVYNDVQYAYTARFTGPTGGSLVFDAPGDTNTLYLGTDWLYVGAETFIDSNRTLRISATTAQYWQVGGTERMRLDSSGNLGLGVTPSAWTSGRQAFQIGGQGAIWAANGTGDDIQIGANAYYDGAYKRIQADYASRYYQVDGKHIWDTAGTSTAGSTISFTQAMTLDASGNLLVGGTTAGNAGTVTINVGNVGSTAGGLQLWAGTAQTSYVQFGDESGTPANHYRGYMAYAHSNDSLQFGTASTERARITSGGDLLVGNSTANETFSGIPTIQGASNCIFTNKRDTTGSASQFRFYNPNGLVGDISTSGSATTYGTSSDRRLKSNIALADDSGAVVDSIQIVKHDWKAGGHVRYGVIAQDLHAVAPEAVKVGDSNETVTDPWGVDYSKLVPMLVKEIQSLRARVAQLEAK